MDKTAEALKNRTKHFLITVLDFAETLPTRTPAAYELARQLSRSAMGVAGNYRSACRARSHTEFTARLGIVLEEADEAELWLDVCAAKSWGDPAPRASLLDEAGQLRAIFSQAVTTARIREHRRQ